MPNFKKPEGNPYHDGSRRHIEWEGRKIGVAHIIICLDTYSHAFDKCEYLAREAGKIEKQKRTVPKSDVREHQRLDAMRETIMIAYDLVEATVKHS